MRISVGAQTGKHEFWLIDANGNVETEFIRYSKTAVYFNR
jgi:hypothetical protein